MNAIDLLKNSLLGIKLFIAGIGGWIVYWVFESLLMTYGFGLGNLNANLFSPNSHELWMRLIVLCFRLNPAR